MIPKYHFVPKHFDTAFSLRHDILPQFGSAWHYHPEMELHYLIQGEGVRFIGNSVNHFSADEMILLGSNLPHTWKCTQKNTHVEALVLHFHPESLGKDFLNVSETQGIKKLNEWSQNGLLIKGKAKETIKQHLWELKEANGLQKLILLFSIFDILLHYQEFEPIAHSGPTHPTALDKTRMDKVFSYTLQQFKNPIRVEEVAQMVNLSLTSFCRYFKMTAGKSYYDFLTEVRLHFACRLLVETPYTIEHIAVESGFENTSNFYRHFKKVKGLTPKAYKTQFNLVKFS